MKRRFLGCLVAVCLVAPGWVGCSEGDDETLPPMCLSTCYSDVSFALATPLSGREIVISVGTQTFTIAH